MVNIAEFLSPGDNCPANQLVIGIGFGGNLNFLKPIPVELKDSATGSKIFFMFLYDASL